MSRADVTEREIEMARATWTVMAQCEDFAIPRIGLAILADRDRLAARLEISDDPEMSVDKIEHLEGMLEFERKHSKRLAAELARVRSAGEALCASLDPVRETLATLPIFAARARFRSALAQPQDGTTEGRG